MLQSIFMDVQVVKVGQKIVVDKDSKQNEVVDHLLEVIGKQKHGFNVMELKIEIFAHDHEVEQVEVDHLKAKSGTI
jgi:hypothetical protein